MWVVLHLDEVNSLVNELIRVQEIVYLFLCQGNDSLFHLFDDFFLFLWCLIIFTTFTKLIKLRHFLLNFFLLFFHFFNLFCSFYIFHLFLSCCISYFRLSFRDSFNRRFLDFLLRIFRLFKLFGHVHKLVRKLISQLSLLACFTFFLLWRHKTLYVAINRLQRQTVTREDITDFDHLAVFHLVP